MARLRKVVSVLLAAAGAITPALAMPAEPADFVLRHGALFTADDASPIADAAAVKGGLIVYLKGDEGVQAFIGPSTRVIDLNGATAAPGFHDSHIHPMSGGMRFLRCDVAGNNEGRALTSAVKRCAAAATPEDWLIGYGIDFERTPKEFFTQALLDKISPDRPALFRSDDGVTAWINSKAAQAAHIAPSEYDPLYPARPSGVVKGDSAAKAIHAIPAPKNTLYRAALHATLERLSQFGVTTVVDASVSPRLIDAYKDQPAAESLARMVLAQRVDLGGDIDAQANRIIKTARQMRSPFMRADAAKFFLDGEFWDGSAALLEPYDDTAKGDGPRIDRKSLRKAVNRLHDAGIQMHFHAMGDRAVREALDALAASASPHALARNRHQIDHDGLVGEGDMARFQKLHVGAGFQPFLTPATVAERAELKTTLGQERFARLFPFARLMESGADIVAGSDGPGPPLNPLEAIDAAIAWTAPRDRKAALLKMLEAYTIAGARYARHEDLVGSLAAGKAADIAIFDRNLFDLPSGHLSNAKIRMTLLNGKPTYCAEKTECF